MNKRINTVSRESYSKVITEIHNALSKDNFDMVLGIVARIDSAKELDEMSQTFLLTYHYNFKSRFLEKADFKYCMKFSDIVNKRVS